MNVIELVMPIRYEPGKQYVFPKPISIKSTICASEPRCKWPRKMFSSGLCIAEIIKKRSGFFLFRGKPLEEQVDYYFLIRR